MSAIEESGIPLEVHLSEWKKMLKSAKKKSGDLVFATQAKGRIKEIEGLIEQQKPEEKKNVLVMLIFDKHTNQYRVESWEVSDSDYMLSKHKVKVVEEYDNLRQAIMNYMKLLGEVQQL